MGVIQPAMTLLMWCPLRTLQIVRRSVGDIVIYEQGVEKRGKDAFLGSSSVQGESAGHNAVHFDNLWPLQKKVKNPITHLCIL